MSIFGLKAAKSIHEELDSSAQWLAAELRNAITPAKLAADQIDGEPKTDILCSVEHILRIAEVLDGADID
jgi:hypothetical protein